MINTIKNEFLLFIKAYFNRVYPDYVTKNKLDKEIPVFVYHHITKEEFEDCLKHLFRNGYTTLTGDQHEQALRDRSTAPERSVVITFDDGLSDVYEIAYPLLQKYNFQAIVFLIPGWIGTSGIVTWEQIREMHESHVIDFQSHSMHHQGVFCSKEVIDYYNPKLENLKRWNFPLMNTENGELQTERPPFGAPVYKYCSRFSDNKRYFPDTKLQDYCVEHVAKNGNEKFFERKHWKTELNEIVGSFRSVGSVEDKFETKNKQITAILKELRYSKLAIEDNLADKKVYHFAWPWNQTGSITTKVLVKSGYKTAFMGLTADALEGKTIEDLFLIKRVTGDFIKCLPGDGRQSFWSVLLHKIFRRLKIGSTY